MTVREYLKISLLSADKTHSTLLEKFLMAAIFLSVTAIILETESKINNIFFPVFSFLEILFFSIFSLEYILRLYFIGFTNKYKGNRGRLKYIISPLAMIDLISILPNIISGLSTDFALLRTMRLLRMIRVAKLVQRNRSLMLFTEAIHQSRSQLAAAIAVTIFLLVIGGVALYLAESSAQPEAFGSIPRAMWWSMATLTTVGYGDVYPVTVIGKLLASTLAILGVGIVAMPAGIIAANFSKKLDDK